MGFIKKEQFAGKDKFVKVSDPTMGDFYIKRLPIRIFKEIELPTKAEDVSLDSVATLLSMSIYSEDKSTPFFTVEEVLDMSPDEMKVFMTKFREVNNFNTEEVGN